MLFLALCSQRCKPVMLSFKTSAQKKKNEWILSTYVTFDMFPGPSNSIHWRQTLSGCLCCYSSVLGGGTWVDSVPFSWPSGLPVSILMLYILIIQKKKSQSNYRLVIILIKVINGVICWEIILVSGSEMRGQAFQMRKCFR